MSLYLYLASHISSAQQLLRLVATVLDSTAIEQSSVGQCSSRTRQTQSRPFTHLHITCLLLHSFPTPSHIVLD
jgi:hypothetical protein